MVDYSKQIIPLQGNDYNMTKWSQFTFAVSEKQQYQQQQQQQQQLLQIQSIPQNIRLASLYTPVILQFSEIQNATRALQLLNGAIINGKVVVAAPA